MLIDKIKDFFSKKKNGIREEIEEYNGEKSKPEKTEDKGIKTDKKKLENLVVFLIILIITILIINYIWSGDKTEHGNDTQTTDANKRLVSSMSTGEIINEGSAKEIVQSTNEKNTIETELEEILTKINGVGEVKVMITYSETNKIVPVYNEESSEENTEETDSEGGTRKVTQTDTKKEVIYEENDNGKTLITQSIISPSIEGAIITAKGANDVTVKTNIIQAVSAVTGLPTHKIQVFEMSI